MTFKTLLTSAAAASALLIASPVIAEDEDWDSDGDGKYSEAEFGEGLLGMGVFKDMDANEDGMVDEDEYNRAQFARYDRDGSGEIDETEREDVDRDFEREDED